MKESKYQNAIRAAKVAAGDGGFVIPGQMLLVEKLPVEEIKSKGGIVLSDSRATQVNGLLSNIPLEVMVVSVGSGFSKEVPVYAIDVYGNEKSLGNQNVDIPLDSQEGDILVVGPHCVNWLSTFPIVGYEPNTLGIVSEDQTQIRFRGAAAYEAFKVGSGQDS